MNDKLLSLIEKLQKNRSLSLSEYRFLIENRTDGLSLHLASLARAEKEKHYGKAVFIRGLIEITNICKNDCLYCGIRKSNKSCTRYRLTPEEILDCCREGYALGFRTFVLQGGEDGYYSDSVLCPLIAEIKKEHPDCAVTLSLGERSYESYKRLYDAGADRYLLRHESADDAHYASLHPEGLTLENRKKCLNDLKSIGYQTGCGFMVGSPGQTSEHLAKDLKFIEEFQPEMCGIGPFIPHKDTPFAKEKAGSVELTLFLLSLIRLINPKILLPATTALGTLGEDGRERGILAGANVVMPNLSPENAKKNYTLYDNKLTTGAENAHALELLKNKIRAVGGEIVCSRGDAIK